MTRVQLGAGGSGDTTLCRMTGVTCLYILIEDVTVCGKVTPVMLHGVVSPDGQGRRGRGALGRRRAHGLGRGIGLKVQGLGLQISGFGFRVSGSGFRSLGVWFRV